MITNDDEHSDGVKNWHYLTVKSISRLLRGITSNHKGDFYCLNCFHSYTTKKRLKKHEKICKDHVQVTHRLYVVYSINQKRNGIITEEKTVWKSFVKI